MSPDLNSLPPSRSPSSSSLSHRNHLPPSPGTTHTPMNPSTTSPRPSRGSSIGRLSVSERRRSAAGMNVNLNEATGAASGNPGEVPWSEHRSSMGHAFRTASPSSHGSSPVFATADPHHQRAPSLGELHQELEQEQEAQVVGPQCSKLFPRFVTLKPRAEPSLADDSQPAIAAAAPSAAESSIRDRNCGHR